MNIDTNLEKLSIESLILKLRMHFNKELFDKKIISFEIYSKMEQILLKKMEKSI